MVYNINYLVYRLNELFGEDYVSKLGLVPFSILDKGGNGVTMLGLNCTDIKINIVGIGSSGRKFDRIDLKVYCDSETSHQDILDEDFHSISEIAWFYSNPPGCWDKCKNIDLFESLLARLSFKKLYPNLYKTTKRRRLLAQSSHNK